MCPIFTAVSYTHLDVYKRQGLSLLAFALVLTQNALTVELSFVGLALAATYPFMKRFHHLPQAHLGAAFGWGIPMAYAAVTDALPLSAWLLFLGNVLWSVIYDTQYAMVDREDDRKIGVKSTALWFGAHDTRIIAYLQAMLLGLLAVIGLLAGRGWIYYLAAASYTHLDVYKRQGKSHRRADQQAFTQRVTEQPNDPAAG